MKKAVILLNMGGPSSLLEVDMFLKNMFNDPRILPIKSPFFALWWQALLPIGEARPPKPIIEKSEGNPLLLAIPST